MSDSLMMSCSNPQCPKGLYLPPSLDTLGDVPLHVPVGSHGPRIEASKNWGLPMTFRPYNPWGWRHGEINAQGKLHPGYDFNDGPTALADMGQPIYAPQDGVVVYAKRVAGWGTLLAIKHDALVNGREVFTRYGHPRDIYVPYGKHVKKGELIATCGDGYRPEVYTPHLHYDIGYVDELWRVSKDRGLGKPDYNWYQMTPANFDKIFIDPIHFHPEVAAYFAKYPTQKIKR